MTEADRNPLIVQPLERGEVAEVRDGRADRVGSDVDGADPRERAGGIRGEVQLLLPTLGAGAMTHEKPFCWRGPSR